MVRHSSDTMQTLIVHCHPAARARALAANLQPSASSVSLGCDAMLGCRQARWKSQAAALFCRRVGVSSRRTSPDPGVRWHTARFRSITKVFTERVSKVLQNHRLWHMPRRICIRSIDGVPWSFAIVSAAFDYAMLNGPGQCCRIMRDYMPKRGKLGHDMMFRSCTIQVSSQSAEAQKLQAVVVGMFSGRRLQELTKQPIVCCMLHQLAGTIEQLFSGAGPDEGKQCASCHCWPLRAGPELFSPCSATLMMMMKEMISVVM